MVNIINAVPYYGVKSFDLFILKGLNDWTFFNGIAIFTIYNESFKCVFKLDQIG